MKFLFIIFLLGIILGAWNIVPIVSTQRACYQTATVGFDGIGFRTNVQNLDEKSICQARFEIIGTLGDCIEASVKDIPVYQQKVLPFTKEITRMTLPYVKQFEDLKNEHNDRCGKYEDFKLE